MYIAQSGPYFSMTFPTANIAVKKNKIKSYPENKVYLQDGQEFEIELFNATTQTKLAKISS